MDGARTSARRWPALRPAVAGAPARSPRGPPAEVILQPLDAVGPQRLAQPNRGTRRSATSRRRPSAPRPVRSARASARPAPRSGGCPPMPASGPSRRKSLTALKPSSRNQVDALFGAVGEVGVAGVAGDALLLRPAQQLVDRPAEQLALQVPQRDVDRADRVAGEPGAAVRCRAAPQHVPVLLGCRGVLPDE